MNDRHCAHIAEGSKVPVPSRKGFGSAGRDHHRFVKRHI